MCLLNNLCKLAQGYYFNKHISGSVIVSESKALSAL